MLAIISFVSLVLIVAACAHTINSIFSKDTSTAAENASLSAVMWCAIAVIDLIALILGAEISALVVFLIFLGAYLTSKDLRMSSGEIVKAAKRALARYIHSAKAMCHDALNFCKAA